MLPLHGSVSARRARRAGVRGQRIVDRSCCTCEKCWPSRRSSGTAVLAGAGERNHFLPAFIAAEEEVLVLADRTAEDAAELVLLVVALRRRRRSCSGSCWRRARRCGSNRKCRRARRCVPPLITVLTTPPASWPYCASYTVVMALNSWTASTLGANSQVLPSLLIGGAVQHEDVVAVAAAGAVELVAVVHVPAARAGESAGAELLLREDHARGQRSAACSVCRPFSGYSCVLIGIEHQAA